jgi:hypothetical protein
MFTSQPIGRAVDPEGSPLSNLTTRLKPMRLYAASTINPSKAGRWRSMKRGLERIALVPVVPGETRHPLRPARKGLTGRTLPTHQVVVAVVQAASSVQMHRRGGTASGRIVLWNQSEVPSDRFANESEGNSLVGMSMIHTRTMSMKTTPKCR